jgi:hypothetical protein
MARARAVSLLLWEIECESFLCVFCLHTGVRVYLDSSDLKDKVDIDPEEFDGRNQDDRDIEGQ